MTEQIIWEDWHIPTKVTGVLPVSREMMIDAGLAESGEHEYPPLKLSARYRLLRFVRRLWVRATPFIIVSRRYVADLEFRDYE